MQDLPDYYSEKIFNKACDDVANVLEVVFEHNSSHRALIVYDEDCDLARVLASIYKQCLPEANTIIFGETEPQVILSEFERLVSKDLVVLIQSTSFRLDKFRIRVNLFQRSLKVIEHPHLSRVPGKEGLIYLDALEYDENYYRVTGRALKQKIDSAQKGVVQSGDSELIYEAGFEDARLNIGDYSEMKNIGGQFPIGEVFTESKELEAVNGSAHIFAFGDRDFSVCIPDRPIKLIIQKGRVVDTVNSTEEFDCVLENIRADEAGEVWVRELGFGMNRAFSKTRAVTDIGTYERMCGVHLSLGAKHHTYKKPGFKFTPRTSRHHVDVFVDTSGVTLDGDDIFIDESWVV